MRTLYFIVLHQIQLNLVQVARQRAAAALAIVQQNEKPKRKKKKFWVRPWTVEDRRLLFGNWDNLVKELRAEDTESYFNYLRMPPHLFDEILHKIEHRIQKKNTNFRRALPAGLKLAVTLRHLGAGDNYPTLAYEFRCNRNSICQFVPAVCYAIHQEYVDEVMKFPQSSDDWKAIAQEFQTRWNVPHALGALDGKHIRIKKPPRSGSLYHNYKGYFSVVLMALVDADYKFLFTDVGGLGHQSDAQLFNHSELKTAMDDGLLNLPDDDPMPNDDQNTPYFFLGDDAFALRKNMMKPYSQKGLSREQRIYNYRYCIFYVSNLFSYTISYFNVLFNHYQCIIMLI